MLVLKTGQKSFSKLVLEGSAMAGITADNCWHCLFARNADANTGGIAVEGHGSSAVDQSCGCPVKGSKGSSRLCSQRGRFTFNRSTSVAPSPKAIPRKLQNDLKGPGTVPSLRKEGTINKDMVGTNWPGMRLKPMDQMYKGMSICYDSPVIAKAAGGPRT